MIANEGEFVRAEKKLTGSNLRSRSALEAKIGVGVESAQGIIRRDFDLMETNNLRANVAFPVWF